MSDNSELPYFVRSILAYKWSLGLLVFAFGMYIFNPLTISVVVGNSMEPTYSQGDLVVHSQYVETSVGDAVVFENNAGQSVVHRVVEEVDTNVYATKGDNNLYRDQTRVRPSNNKGTVIMHIPLSEYIPQRYTDRLGASYPSGAG